MANHPQMNKHVEFTECSDMWFLSLLMAARTTGISTFSPTFLCAQSLHWKSAPSLLSKRWSAYRVNSYGQGRWVILCCAARPLLWWTDFLCSFNKNFTSVRQDSLELGVPLDLDVVEELVP